MNTIQKKVGSDTRHELVGNNGVVIAGGGIGGLATALALQQRGIPVRVYESVLVNKPVGAGISLAPNAMEVLDHLGCKEEVMQRGYAVASARTMSARGKVLQTISFRELNSGEHPLVMIHRAELHDILIQRLKPNTLLMGKMLQTFQEKENWVDISFGDGTQTRGDILVGADGIRSRVRTLQMGAGVVYRYSGQTCWRGVVPFRLPASMEMCEMWSEKPGVRIGFGYVTPRDVYFFVTECTPAGGKDAPGSVHQYLSRLCEDFPPFVQEMLFSCEESSFIRSDIWDFEPLRSWHKGRVVLLGDAAHATTPNLGQGGCQALEDAIALAHALVGESSIESAFRKYEAIRMEKAQFVVRTSYRFGQMTNLGGIQARIRNFIAAKSPRSVLKKQMRYLFTVVSS